MEPQLPIPLVPALQTILDAELANGNEVRLVEMPMVSHSNWPPGCELMVTVRNKFCRPYPLEPGFEYRLINDPHYWFAEYDYNRGQQIIVCGFG